MSDIEEGNSSSQLWIYMVDSESLILKCNTRAVCVVV